MDSFMFSPMDLLYPVKEKRRNTPNAVMRFLYVNVINELQL